MTVGDRIRIRRERLGMTQDELAKKLGHSSRSTVSKAEKWGNDITTWKVKRYAEALDCSFEYLMGWEDKVEKREGAPSGLDVDAIASVLAKKMSEEGYYVYPAAAQEAQELFENEDMRLLFDAAKDSKPEDLRMAADLLKRLKQTNEDG